MDSDWTRVSEDHPDCCESPGCINKKMTGARFCPAHGGNMGARSAAKKSLKNYRLGKWKSQLTKKLNSSELKGLTEEIAILRQIIEEHLNQCQDSTDLMLKSGPLGDLVMKVNTLVNSCNAIDKTLGNLIDKERVVAFAQAILTIITPYIPESKLNELNSKIKDALGQL